MARPSVYFDPGNVTVQPAANPVNLSNVFHAQPVETLDLMPMLSAGLWAAGKFQEVDERKQAEQYAKDVAAHKEKLKVYEQQALILAAEDPEGLTGTEEQLSRHLQAFGAGQASDPDWVAMNASMAGDRIGQRYRNTINQAEEEASKLLNENGEEKIPFDVDAFLKKTADEVTRGAFGLTTLEGAAAFANQKLDADAKFKAKVSENLTAARVAFGNKMEENKAYNLTTELGQKGDATSMDYDFYWGNFSFMEDQMAVKGKSATARGNVMAGVQRALEHMDNPDRVLGMLPWFAEQRYSNGEKVGSTIEGQKMLDAVSKYAISEKERVDREQYQKEDRLEKETKKNLTESHFSEYFASSVSGQALDAVKQKMEDKIAKLPKSLQKAAREEIASWDDLAKRRTGGNQGMFSRLLKENVKGNIITLELQSQGVKDELSGDQYKTLVEANRHAQDVNEILKKSAYTQIKGELAKKAETFVFPNLPDDKDQSALRARFAADIQPLLDKFDENSRALVTTLIETKNVDQLDAWLQTSMDADKGIAKKIQDKFDLFVKDREEFLEQVRIKTNSGQSYVAELRSPKANKLLGSTERTLLETRNEAAADAVQYLPGAVSGNFATKFNAFTAETASKITKQEGTSELFGGSEDLAERSLDASRAAWARFKEWLTKQRTDGNPIDEETIKFQLDTFQMEEVKKSKKETFEQSNADPNKVKKAVGTK